MKNYFVSLVAEIDSDDDDLAKSIKRKECDYDNYMFIKDIIVQADEMQEELIEFVEDLESCGISVVDSWYEIINEDNIPLQEEVIA